MQVAEVRRGVTLRRMGWLGGGCFFFLLCGSWEAGGGECLAFLNKDKEKDRLSKTFKTGVCVPAVVLH